MHRPITLGELIDQLGKGSADNEVRFDFPGQLPTSFDSYRGYYDQLALGHGQFSYADDFQTPTVSSLLEAAKSANGTIFTGWKGGDYRMGNHTPIWVDNPGHFSGVAILEVRHGYVTHLITGMVE